MSKIEKIDFSGDRLLAIAEEMVDNHNYIGALKMLNKNAEADGDDEDSLMLYAEIFDDMGLYEKSVNGWFRYMDYAEGPDMSDCYEGLAIGFMNLGDEHFSAYYYNKLLLENDEIDVETRESIVKDFLSSDDNPLKFAYPPQLADCSDVVRSGIAHMRAGEYQKAAEIFDEIEEGNEKYIAARGYIAMCNIICDDLQSAENECRAILEKKPDDVQTLTTLAAVMTESGRKDEALALAKKLVSLEVKNSDERYKIATVCCENGLHAEAYDLFCSLDELEYDLTVTYFKAVSAFNCGKYEESFGHFDDLLTVYPDAVTARYYFNLAKSKVENGEGGELSYFYRLPQEIRESSLKMLAAYMRLSERGARKLSENLDLSDCIKWCFDEADGVNNDELKSLAAQAAVKADMDGIVRKLLLNAFIPDRIKIVMLTGIAERNADDNYGVVICNIYKCVNIYSLTVGRHKRKIFVRAVARLTAHFSIIDDRHGEKFVTAAEKLYRKLEKKERLDGVKDLDALCAAIYITSGVREAGISGERIYDFFDTKREKVDKILGKV